VVGDREGSAQEEGGLDNLSVNRSGPGTIFGRPLGDCSAQCLIRGYSGCPMRVGLAAR
jgi:hypothetical protein